MKWKLHKVVTHLIIGNLIIGFCLFFMMDSYNMGLYKASALFGTIILAVNRYLSWLNFKEIDESNPEDNG